MSAITKRAIEESFKKLLSEQPLEKITVKNITDDCGVNRNTFYYHYSDIYELLEEIFMEEAQKAVDNMNTEQSWEDGFCSGLRFVKENKKLIYHVYNSLHRETIERYLYKVSFDFMLKFIDHVSSDLIVDESDKNFIAAFYKFALVGIMLDWLEGGMKTEPDELISRLSKILSGTLRTVLLNADKSGKSNS
ncbi:MAG: TetR/AcrR family transcriptional regulator [Ruminiclostridium sp.]